MMKEEITLKPFFWFKSGACYHKTKKFELEKFLLTHHFKPKSSKFQNYSKNDAPSGSWEPPGGTMFLSEILILISSIIISLYG